MVILVADDDRLVRFTVKSMLAEILENEYSILEAANGRDMIELCREKQPDIVFADIKMPYVNGLDAIAEAKKENTRTEFVIISGYSDFEYAKKGIKLGIHDYLLKPVEEEQLQQVVEKLKEKLEKQKTQSNSEFQLKLLDLFNYFSTVGVVGDYEECELPYNFRYRGFALFMKNSRRQKENPHIHKKIIEEVQKLGRENVKSGGYFVLLYSGEGTPYFVFASSPTEDERICSRMRKVNMSIPDESDSIMFNFQCDSIKEIYRISETLDANFWVGMNYPSGSILKYQEEEITESGRELLKMIYQLLNAWENADGVVYKEILNKMYRENKDKILPVQLSNVAAYCSKVTGEKISSDSYKAFCRALVDISEQMYKNVSSEESGLIEQIKEYIQKYYMNDISISQIADQYHLTANYLSTIFHNKAGCKFIDYLTDIRMANAKRLLIKNASASIQDIAMLVGYNSARHFSTVFQKQMGMTPTAYRKEKI